MLNQFSGGAHANSDLAEGSPVAAFDETSPIIAFVRPSANRASQDAEFERDTELIFARHANSKYPLAMYNNKTFARASLLIFWRFFRA